MENNNKSSGLADKCKNFLKNKFGRSRPQAQKDDNNPPSTTQQAAGLASNLNHELMNHNKLVMGEMEKNPKFQERRNAEIDSSTHDSHRFNPTLPLRNDSRIEELRKEITTGKLATDHSHQYAASASPQPYARAVDPKHIALGSTNIRHVPPPTPPAGVTASNTMLIMDHPTVTPPLPPLARRSKLLNKKFIHTVKASEQVVPSPSMKAHTRQEPGNLLISQQSTASHEIDAPLRRILNWRGVTSVMDNIVWNELNQYSLSEKNLNLAELFTKPSKDARTFALPQQEYNFKIITDTDREQKLITLFNSVERKARLMGMTIEEVFESVKQMNRLKVSYEIINDLVTAYPTENELNKIQEYENRINYTQLVERSLEVYRAYAIDATRTPEQIALNKQKETEFKSKPAYMYYLISKLNMTANACRLKLKIMKCVMENEQSRSLDQVTRQLISDLHAASVVLKNDGEFKIILYVLKEMVNKTDGINSTGFEFHFLLKAVLIQDNTQNQKPFVYHLCRKVREVLNDTTLLQTCEIFNRNYDDIPANIVELRKKAAELEALVNQLDFEDDETECTHEYARCVCSSLIQLSTFPRYNDTFDKANKFISDAEFLEGNYTLTKKEFQEFLQYMASETVFDAKNFQVEYFCELIYNFAKEYDKAFVSLQNEENEARKALRITQYC